MFGKIGAFPTGQRDKTCHRNGHRSEHGPWQCVKLTDLAASKFSFMDGALLSRDAPSVIREITGTVKQAA
jgi:hypothetical protein